MWRFDSILLLRLSDGSTWKLAYHSTSTRKKAPRMQWWNNFMRKPTCLPFQTLVIRKKLNDCSFVLLDRSKSNIHFSCRVFVRSGSVKNIFNEQKAVNTGKSLKFTHDYKMWYKYLWEFLLNYENSMENIHNIAIIVVSINKIEDRNVNMKNWSKNLKKSL